MIKCILPIVCSAGNSFRLTGSHNDDPAGTWHVLLPEYVVA